MGEVTDTVKNHMREDAAREGSAFRRSGPWFLAAIGALVVGVAVYKLAGDIPGAVFFIAALVLLPLAVHKHGQAGGDTSGMTVGMSQD